MLTDLEIVRKSKPLPIEKIARSAGLSLDEIDYYGKYIAKVKLAAYEKRKNKKNGKLILVTTITPTPYGEGKTTMTIGLAQVLKKIGKRSFVCIREPSLGPTLGLKGGAAGGGWSQVIPMEDINLHFTGDMHMISSAHNYLAAMLDNHIYFGNHLGFDIDKISWNRVIDMNDRALRKITLEYKDIRRTSSFDIAAASEAMAVTCLSMNFFQLRQKLGSIITGFSSDGRPLTSADLKADGAMALLLKDAIKPNLVQTIEGVPAFVHGGPFANIAHGCNSLIATKLALKLADYVVTEAGFGSDLGAEKFFDIKCRLGGLRPDAVVLVVTTKALKWQGGVARDKWRERNEEALKKGLWNLEKHIEGLKNYSVPIIVAVNRYDFDDESELNIISGFCEKEGIPCAVSDVREKGGAGGKVLAEIVVESVKNKDSSFKLLYEDSLSAGEKLDVIAKKIYHNDGVSFSSEAQEDLSRIRALGFDRLPVCIAKTQFSFTDDHTRIGDPAGLKINIKKLKICAGAGFIVAYAGDIMTMPGLPQHPASENMYIDDCGEIHGIF
ncbi:MAG: formate--tetrahydrofolate ligase [Candidatus Margulisiibacteriota bacterium]